MFSRLCCFLGYGETQKGYRCYDPASYHLCISHNVVFWEHRLFVELFHFRASLSSSFVLDIFSDEAHIHFVAAHDPSVVAPNSLVHFSVQPPDIIDPFSSSPFNEQVEDEQVEDELPNPNPELGSPALAPPEDLARDIPPRHSTRVRSIPAHLLEYHCYTALATLHKPQTYREASTDPLWKIAMKEEFDALSKYHTWDLVTLPPGNLWLVVNGSTRLRPTLMGPLNATKLVLLQKVLHRSMGLIMMRPLSGCSYLIYSCPLSCCCC